MFNCPKYVDFEQKNCIKEIPEGYFLEDNIQGIIGKCHQLCKTCERGQTEINGEIHMNCKICKYNNSQFNNNIEGNCPETQGNTEEKEKENTEEKENTNDNEDENNNDKKNSKSLLWILYVIIIIICITICIIIIKKCVLKKKHGNEEDKKTDDDKNDVKVIQVKVEKPTDLIDTDEEKKRDIKNKRKLPPIISREPESSSNMNKQKENAYSDNTDFQN